MIDFDIKTSQSGNLLAEIEKAVNALSKKQLLVGVMSEGRKGPNASPLTNSQIAFLMEFGSPEVKLPARPFLFPMLRANAEYIQYMLGQAFMAALHGSQAGIDKCLTALGTALVADMRKRIRDGIMPPLSRNTLRKWVSLKLGKRGKPLSTSKRREDYGTTPYVVTGQFLKSLGFVIENNSGGIPSISSSENEAAPEGEGNSEIAAAEEETAAVEEEGLLASLLNLFR